MRALLTLFLFSTATPSPGRASLPSRNVIVLRPDGAPGGSAVLISHNLVLTAAHVLKSSVVAVVCGSQHVLPALVLAIDADGDLAVLALPAPCIGTRVSSIALADPELGSDVYAVGCPNQACGRITRGVVSSYEPGLGTRGVELISDVKVWFGNSGGGLFDEDGTLVGINSNLQKFSSTTNPGYDVMYDAAVPASRIRAWLKQEGIEVQ